MVLSIVWLVVGLILILWGASALTDGASAIARKMGVSDLVIGMTVIGFGTSMPELSVSLLSAIGGNASIAIGNVVGSNLVNILLIVGLTALIRPIAVDRSAVSRDLPILIVSAIVLLVMGNSVILDRAEYNILSRVDGIILLLFFAIYMVITLRSAGTSDSQPADNDGKKPKHPVVNILMIVIGLGALVWGADRFVDGASAVARAIGVSDAVIGLTIVAAGTSLPELATAITSAIKGRPGLALGNVIGSNIFNTLMVLGVTSTVKPLEFNGIGNFDLLTMLAATIMFWVFARYYKDVTITRVEGALLFISWLAYTAVLLV